MNRAIAAFVVFVTAAFIAAAQVSTPVLRAQRDPVHPPIAVGPTIHVSAGRPHDQFYELQLAADPADANRLLGCSMVLTRSKSAYNSVVYASFDGGRTWSLTFELDRGPYTDDPTCTYGPDGSGYAAFLGGDKGPRLLEMYVFYSPDAGRSWQPAATLPRFDREYLTVDLSGAQHQGRVYLHGNDGVPALQGPRPGDPSFNTARGVLSTFAVRTSVDRGATFGPPAHLVATGNGSVGALGNGVVLSDGTYVALFGEVLDLTRIRESRRPVAPNMRLRAAISRDGGETLLSAVTVSDWHMNFDVDLGTSSSLPVLAADRSTGPFRDRLYAVWPDVRSGRNEILLSYSSDKGRSWSRPVAVNDDWSWPGSSPGPDADMPQVAVNTQGVVGVTWYDRRENPDNVGWRVRFSASIDGGDSFLPSVKVSEASPGYDRAHVLGLEAFPFGGRNPFAYQRETPLRIRLSPSKFTFNGGHTGALAADAGGAFHPFWVDNRSGVSQIYTARVTVEGTARRNGAVDLQEFEDVSEYVALRLANAEYTRATQTVRVEASLLNTSSYRVAGPLRLQALQVTSAAGSATVVNADNNSPGVHALWDFTTVLEDGSLQPGGRSKGRQLEFRLSQPAVILPSEALARTGLVTMRAKILGKVPPAARSSDGSR